MTYKSGRVINNITFEDTDGVEHGISGMVVQNADNGEEVVTLSFINGKTAKVITRYTEVRYGDDRGRL